MKLPEIYTEEQIKLSKKNNYRAWKLLGYDTKGSHKGLQLHHKDPNLRYEDPERYIEWNLEDLVVLTNSEHAKLHHDLGTFGDSAWNKGLTRDTDDRVKKLADSRIGHEVSSETRDKISKSLTGRSIPIEERWKHGTQKGMHWKVVDGKRVWY